MHRGLAATRAILLQFQAIRVIPAILLGDVVTLFALAAHQGDLWADVGRLAGHSLFTSMSRAARSAAFPISI